MNCGRFLGPLRGPSQRGAELGRRAATERIAAPLRIVSADPAPELLDEAGGVQSDQSLPCQNSFLSRPKKPSIAALSGLQPLADWIGYTDVDSSGGRKRREDRVRVPARGPRGGAAWVRRLSTRSTSLMTGSYSISTSRMMSKRSPVRKCWVRVLWTMFQHAGIEFACGNHAVPMAQQQVDENAVARGERTAKGAVVDATRTARGATVL